MNPIRVTTAMAITAASVLVSAAGPATAQRPELDTVSPTTSFDIAAYVTARKTQIAPQLRDLDTVLQSPAFDIAAYVTMRKVVMSAQRAGTA